MAATIRTVGTGKTYATIQAAINASSSGDIILVYAGGVANVYDENVAVGAGKVYTIIGMVANRGITITHSSGVVVNLMTAYPHHFENFKVVATGAATYALDAYSQGHYQMIINCEFVGGSSAAARGYVGTRFYNCLARDSAGDGFQSNQDMQCFNCTSVDNGANGFNCSNARLINCLAAGNTTKDFVSGAMYYCVSEDATAAGVLGVTGFDTADFVDYAGNDFRLKAAVIGSTKAEMNGYPYVRFDELNFTRSTTTNKIYAGWHDPHPANASLELSGTFTATLHTSQNAIVIDMSGLAQSGGVKWRFAVRAGASPVGVEESYFMSECPIDKTSWEIMQNSDGTQIKAGTYYITIGAENANGTNWLGTAVAVTAWGYLEEAD